jgi:hypothetical protein
MQDVLGENRLEELHPRPNSAFAVQVIDETNSYSYATMSKLRLAIARQEWRHGAKRIAKGLGRNAILCAPATDQETGDRREVSQNGVGIACIWMVCGIQWFPGHRGGGCAMINRDQISETIWE